VLLLFSAPHGFPVNRGSYFSLVAELSVALASCHLRTSSFAHTAMTLGNGPMSIVVQGAALVSLIWSCTVFLVQGIGITQMYGTYLSSEPAPLLTRSPQLPPSLCTAFETRVAVPERR
jgi:hypothetical protein